MWRRVYCWVKKISKQAQPFRLRSTSVLKIFLAVLNHLKNYILVNYSNISSSFNHNFKKSWLVEPVWPSSWMSSDPFYSILPNLYKWKPIWPHFMQLFGPRKILELDSKHLLVWFTNVGSFKVSIRCCTIFAAMLLLAINTLISGLNYQLYVPKRGILCVGWLKY